MRLKDKVVAVTASTRGIGYACVEACAKEGAVVYMAARNLERAKKSAEEFREQGYDVRVVYHDATKPESNASMVEEIVKEAGRIDVLVNNFGSTDVKKDLDFLNTSYEDFHEILDLNLRTVYEVSQKAAEKMAEQGGGSIVNISSIGGVLPDISRIAYAVSKNAINYLTKNMALQLGRSGIRVNSVCPGQTATDAVMDNMSEQLQEFFNRHTPIRRMGKPEEDAHLVVYLASEESAYTTGQVISVSGGFGLGTPVYADLAEMSAKNRG